MSTDIQRVVVRCEHCQMPFSAAYIGRESMEPGEQERCHTADLYPSEADAEAAARGFLADHIERKHTPPPQPDEEEEHG